MRNLILKMNVSLDGFVAGPNGEIDWMFRDLDGAKTWIVDTLWKAGVHIMGSRTYADMAAYWPSSTDVLAAPMNQIPKVVFSRSGRLRRRRGRLKTHLVRSPSRTRVRRGASRVSRRAISPRRSPE